MERILEEFEDVKPQQRDNTKLEDETMDKMLEEFEDVEHQRDNTKKLVAKNKVKGKQVGIKKIRKNVGALAMGRVT
jgi:hypothetical protein